MSTTEHGFKAEVNQLLKLMIHSVYADREVFIRELISNAADALDKVRFLGLTHDNLTAAGSENPGIQITVDTDANTITLTDDGVGLTEEEANNNLGTIARSGTKAFLEQLKDTEDAPKLIGQFGLGFYSAFMVAERVTVQTLSAMPDAKPVKWESEGEGSYVIGEGDRTHRGTSITLHLREDAKEFAEPTRLQTAIKKHSNFLPWPIMVDGEQANDGKALWAEQPSQVTTEEANAFYKNVATDWQDPARKLHVSVDSPIQYSALLFYPASRPYDLFQPQATKGPRLYARRVLIEENCTEMMPEWLRFMRGVVDSEDIPLNVSREMVQKTPIVRKIRDALVKRVLKDLGKWAKKGTPEPAEGDDKPVHTYNQFWANFGLLLKEGYYHDRHNWGEQLLPLLRFNAVSHDDGDGLMSLAEYKEAMPEGQDTIWYLTGESRSAALSSPHLEAFKKKGYNVLLLTDPVDEWLTSALTEFDGMEIKSVSRGELDLEDEEDGVEKADLDAFAPWAKDLLADHVSDVRESNRLTDSAAVLVDADDGMSANMQRILKQANQDSFGGSKRVLELNPKHPLIKNLTAMQTKGRLAEAEAMTRLLLDDAQLMDGSVSDPAAIGRRLQALLVQASEQAAQ